MGRGFLEWHLQDPLLVMYVEIKGVAVSRVMRCHTSEENKQDGRDEKVMNRNHDC